VNAVRGSLRLAVASRGALGSFTHTQAVSLMLVTYRRTGDSSYLDAARAALDLMVDSADSTGADGARDEPPTLLRAGLVRARPRRAAQRHRRPGRPAAGPGAAGRSMPRRLSSLRRAALPPRSGRSRFGAGPRLRGFGGGRLLRLGHG